MHQLLRLRRWALTALSGSDRRDHSAPPVTSPAAWDTFLRSERCAHALTARLEDGGAETLRSAVRHTLNQNATREIQRTLSARAQLRRIGELALLHELQVVVLKGGRAVAVEGAVHDLVDLDLLVRSAAADRFAELLASEGYEATRSTPGLEHHLAQRRLPNLVPVEIHTALKRVDEEVLQTLWSRVEPLEGVPGLLRLASPDHLWYQLIHSGVQHPDRRGSLRELLLMEHALAECEDGEIAATRDRLRRHPAAAPLLQWLDMALAFHEDRVAEDPFSEVAGVNYLFVGRLLPAGVPRTVALPLAKLTLQHLGHVGDHDAWSQAVGSVASPRRFISAVERRLPAVGGWLRVVLRVGRLAALDPAARLLAASARTAARRARRERRTSYARAADSRLGDRPARTESSRAPSR